MHPECAGVEIWSPLDPSANPKQNRSRGPRFNLHLRGCDDPSF